VKISTCELTGTKRNGVERVENMRGAGWTKFGKLRNRNESAVSG